MVSADTHSVYFGKGVSSSISGKETVIGSDVDPGTSDVQAGNGIWVDGSSAKIEDVRIKYNRKDGVRFDNSSHTITSEGVEWYTGEEYDYKLTDDAETSAQPRMVADGQSVYLAYLNEESNSVYFKSSGDRGGTWSDRKLLVTSSENVERIDLAADGDRVVVVWESSESWTYGFIYSSDGGRTWNVDDNYYDGVNPSIEVEGNQVYVTYCNSITGPWQEPWIFTEFYWTEKGFEQGESKELLGQWACTDIEAKGSSVYIVALTSAWEDYDGDIYFWRSDDKGHTWSIDKKYLGTYSATFDTTIPDDDWVDLSVQDDHIGIVWADDGTGEYEIEGEISTDGGDSWSPRLQFSDEPMVPSVFPSADMDINQKWHITWQEGDNIKHSRMDLPSYTMDVEWASMVPSCTSVKRPSISTSNTDAFLSWSDGRDGDQEVYVKRQDPSSLTNSTIEDNTFSNVLANHSSPFIKNCEIKDADFGLKITNESNLYAENVSIYLSSYDSISVNSSFASIRSARVDGSYDYDFNISSDSEVIAKDSSFDKLNTKVSDSSTLIYSSVLDLTIIDEWGAPYPEGDVEIYINNTYGNEIFRGYNEKDGKLTNVSLTLYEETKDGRVYEAPFDITVKTTDYTNSLTVLPEMINQTLDVTIGLSEDDDNDGLNNAEENKIFDIESDDGIDPPGDPKDPGLYALYNYTYQTRDYDRWEESDNNYIATDKIVVRRGTELTLDGYRDGALEFEGIPSNIPLDWTTATSNSNNNRVSSFSSASKGKNTAYPRWMDRFSTDIVGSPLVDSYDNGRIYFTDEKNIYCYDESGSEIASKTLNPGYSNPVLANMDREPRKEVFVPTETGVGCYQDDLTEVWFADTLGDEKIETPSTLTVAEIDGTQAIIFSAVYSSNGQGVVAAIDIMNGDTICKYETGTRPILTPPAVGDIDGNGDQDIVTKTVIGVPTNHHYEYHEEVIRLEVQNGDMVKVWNEAVDIASVPVITDIGGTDAVVFGTENGYLTILDGIDGSLIDNFEVGNAVYSSPVIDDIDNDGNKEILFGSDNGKFYCLEVDGNTLSQEWSYNTGEKIRSTPVLADFYNSESDNKEVVFCSYDGYVYCMDSSGNRIWNYNSSDPIFSSPSVADFEGDGKAEICFGTMTDAGGTSNFTVLNTTRMYEPGDNNWIEGDGPWIIDLPEDMPIGRYRIKVSDGTFEKTMDLLAIFQLPESMDADNRSAFCYDDMSVEKEEKTAHVNYIEKHSSYGQKENYYLHSFNNNNPEYIPMLDFAISSVAGSTSRFEASRRIYRLANQRIEYPLIDGYPIIIKSDEITSPPSVTWYDLEEYLNHPEETIDGVRYRPMSLETSQAVSTNKVPLDSLAGKSESFYISGTCGNYAALSISLGRAVGMPSQMIQTTSSAGGHAFNINWFSEHPEEDQVSNWLVMDATQINDGSRGFTLENVDNMTEAYTSVLWNNGLTLNYISSSSSRWNPDSPHKNSINEGKGINWLEKINVQWERELTVGETTHLWMGYGDREFFKLDLTSHSDDKVVSISNCIESEETISCAIYANLDEGSGDNYPYFDGYDEVEQHCTYFSTIQAEPSPSDTQVSLELTGGEVWYILVAPYLVESPRAHGNTWKMIIEVES